MPERGARGAPPTPHLPIHAPLSITPGSVDPSGTRTPRWPSSSSCGSSTSHSRPRPRRDRRGGEGPYPPHHRRHHHPHTRTQSHTVTHTPPPPLLLMDGISWVPRATRGAEVGGGGALPARPDAARSAGDGRRDVACSHRTLARARGVRARLTGTVNRVVSPLRRIS